MNAAEQNRLSRLFDRVPQAVSLIAVAVGLLVLLGWLFDLDAPKSVLPGLTAMKANTAFGFILSGVALWTTRAGNQGMQVGSRVCAGLLLLLGLLTLGEYLSGADFGIDQLLIREITNLPGDIPGRMAVNTALSFAALGAALLLLSQKNGGQVMAIHVLVMVPILAAGSALIGYGYDIDEFLRVKLSYTPMAVNTAAVFVLLALGIVNARSDYPFRRFMTSGNVAGITVRHLLPAAIVFTLMTGWLIHQGYRSGYYGEAFALALFTVASIAGLGTLILWNAGTLYEVAAQRERAEESLRENEERLNTIIKILPVGVWVMNAEGKLVLGNNAAQRIWAGVRWVGSEQLGEHKGWRLDSGRPVGAHEWAGARAVEKGETSIEEEIEIECFDGTHKIILDSAVPLRRSDGSIRGAVTINHDITELKRTEYQLKERIKELRAFYSLTDLAERAGLALDSLYQELANILPQSWQYPEFACARIVVGESEFRTDNFSVSEWMQAAPFKVHGAVAGKIEVGYLEQKQAQDEGPFLKEERQLINAIAERVGHITERKRTEEELRKYREQLEELVRERTSELEAANKDLEEFVYSLSHDLRVPLRAVDGFSGMLLSGHADKLDDEGKRLLNVVRLNTKRMEQLIDDILAFSRMGQIVMSASEVDMEELARTVFEELKPGFAGRELALKVKPLPQCRGDREMLRQVWANLLDNAVKFTRPRAAALVEVGGRTEGTETIYYVKDNGAGFDMQYAGKLFGVFQRVHGVEEFEGAGIGLAIVKRIITRHGGRVWAEGRVNEGATFYFALPVEGKNT